MKNLKVIKKDGKTEDFHHYKIVNSIINAGATSEEAEKIAENIEGWVKSNAQNNTINTSEIRTKVIEQLKNVNPDATQSYENYKK